MFRNGAKDKITLLSERVAFEATSAQSGTSDSLAFLQLALTEELRVAHHMILAD